MRARGGFTLIELLVVIAIIALLMSILMPAMSAVREQGRRSVCAQNEKNTGLGLHMYSNDYNGKVPLNEVSRWLFDISYWTTDVILRSGGFDRDIFYCPSWSQRNNIIFWRYWENLPLGTPENYGPEPMDTAWRKEAHRILGYYWFLDHRNPTSGKYRDPPMSPDGQQKEWVRSLIATKRAPAMVDLISDVVASDGSDRERADFTRASGGCLTRWGVYDRTNHLRNTNKAAGGNVLFVDGHVQWRKFDEMYHRWFKDQFGNPCLWW